MKENAKPRTLNMRRLEPYVWLLPSILLIGVMILVPIFSVFQTSFSEISKSGVNKGFNGVSNYLWIFQNPTFWNRNSTNRVTKHERCDFCHIYSSFSHYL